VTLRVFDLVNSVTYQTHLYVSRGLFEAHRLLFVTELCFQIVIAEHVSKPKEMQNPNGFSYAMLSYLTRFPKVADAVPPLDWLTSEQWGAVLSLTSVEQFSQLPSNIESAAKRWRKWCENECPEREQMPQVIHDVC
jgi:dynein heavy chain, axonemal